MLSLGSTAMMEIAEEIKTYELKLERLMGQRVKLQIVELEELPARNVFTEFQFMNRVLDVTAECGHTSVKELKGEGREHPLPDLRYIAYTIIKDKYPKASQVQIGAIFGNRDHSSVSHGLKQFKDLWQTSPSFRNTYLIIKKSLGHD